mmetsp:Transcript_19427/g.23238  ORF Transcript_19427/g.23238 Transcript_19427/m.23238 type:complete len:122 (-) Transcript_19427:753-1118(-)|eukprot:CAMPEP_0197852918 /NCGR_PEP_ID=MMETSP1438-20131217/21707_1 /TAXON_ID=1461541 /ORGANISM="Pterosperma sp., Strain CCMP1384" /LENGTH=121 /DNA_ID=CAMNT_0043467143 /DNA_START=349 /DNA_END=714 /DNA_ORIENTATION=+
MTVCSSSERESWEGGYPRPEVCDYDSRQNSTTDGETTKREEHETELEKLRAEIRSLRAGNEQLKAQVSSDTAKRDQAKKRLQAMRAAAASDQPDAKRPKQTSTEKKFFVREQLTPCRALRV